MPLPTSIAKLHGAASIAPTYHIVVKVTDPSSYSFYFTHICAIDNATEVPLARVHRSISTAINDWKYENLQWNSTDPNRGLCVRFRMKCEEEREREWEEKEKARDIENLAQRNGERMPDKREALAMACMMKVARRAVGRVLHEKDFGAMGQKEFVIISTESEGIVQASLSVDSKEEQRVVARVSGNDHFEAVYALDDAVGVEHKKQRREEQRWYIS